MKNLVVLLIVLLPFTAVAQTSPCTTQVYGDFSKELDWNCPVPSEETVVPRLDIPNASVPLAKDAKAPFAGLLLDQQRVLQLGLRITGLRRLLWIELKMAKEKQALAVDRAVEVTRQDAQVSEAQNKLLEARVNQLTGDLEVERAWYRSWTFGFVLGMTITSATAISIAVVAR